MCESPFSVSRASRSEAVCPGPLSERVVRLACRVARHSAVGGAYSHRRDRVHAPRCAARPTAHGGALLG
eukprot:5018865-Prymnesium_polylepis.2